MIGGIIGGVTSAVVGGDFYRGFTQGAIITAFNHLLHNATEGGEVNGIVQSEESSNPPKIGDQIAVSVGNNGAFFLYTYTKSGWVSQYYPGGSAVQTTDSPLEWGIGVSLKSIRLTAVAATKTSVQFTKSSLSLGQQMHKAYKVGANGIKEFRLPSGRRIDFLDIKNGIIYELKPNNPRAILQGQRQLQIYLQEIQSMQRFQGVNWKTVLETY